MKIKRFTALLISMVMMVSMIAGCGTVDNAITDPNTGTNAKTDIAQPADSNEPAKEPVTVSLYIQKNAVDAWGAKVKELFEAENEGIKIEWNMLPEDNVQAFQKMDMAVMSGDTTDIVLLQNPNYYSRYVSGNLLAPLNDLAKEANYDIASVFGDYAKQYDGNGTYYWLPDSVTMNICFYNKKIFDDNEVSYPTGKWTWDEYIEIAKKLTNAPDGVYGNYFQYDWEYYNYLQANQKNTPAYKEDGTSNFDDPAWADSIKWLNDLSQTHKIMPTRAEWIAKKYQFDSFMSGKFGMTIVGTWYLGLLQDSEKYPRDWEVGVCAPPVPADGKGSNILSAGGGFGLTKTAAHPKEAFKVLTFICEEEYTVNGGVTPARVDITKDDMLDVFAATSESLNGEVTADELYNACYAPYLGVANEKIIGTASSQINDTFTKEAEMYQLGNQTLEETMNNIKTKSDDFIVKAIEDAK